MKNIYLIFSLLFVNTLIAQTVDENYRKSLKEVLTQVETRFHLGGHFI